MINNIMVLKSIDAIDEPLHFQSSSASWGVCSLPFDNLVFLKELSPPGHHLVGLFRDLSIYTVAPVAIAAGGHVRVGLEDCIRIAKGVLADSSAQMVAKMKHISELLGREVATPAEARRILSL